VVSGLLQDLRYRKLWVAIGVGLIVLVVYFSLTPDRIDTGTVEGFDPGHMLAYFTLMAWWAQIVRAGWPRVALALALVAMGVGMEFAQGLTDYRVFDPADMRDNAIGVAVAFVLVLTPLGRVLAAVERRHRAASP
jgi:hypothetical protein